MSNNESNNENNKELSFQYIFVFPILSALFIALLYSAYIFANTKDLDDYIAMDLAGEKINCKELSEEIGYDVSRNITTFTKLERDNKYTFSQCRVELDKKHAKECKSTVSKIFESNYLIDTDEQAMLANKKYCEKQFLPYLDKRIISDPLDTFSSGVLLEVGYTGEYYNITSIKKIKKAEEVFIKGLYRVVIYTDKGAFSMYFDDKGKAEGFIVIISQKLSDATQP